MSNSIPHVDDISQPLQADSTAVQSYLSMLQSVIARMATNSANCKTWCVTLVSTIIVLASDKPEHNYASFSLVPILIFFMLDTYYLEQERSFRRTYNIFLKKLHTSKAVYSDLYVIRPTENDRGSFISIIMASISFSTLPFYLLFLVSISLIRYLTF